MEGTPGFWEWIVSLFERGGLLMYPITASAVVALGILIERLVALRRSKVAPRAFMAYVDRLLREDKLSEARASAVANDSSAAILLLAGLKHLGRSRELLRETFEDAGRQELAYLERHVGWLGTIGSVSPLLGLLGTVAGMIRAFQDVVSQVSQQTAVDPGHLAAGIWAALVTTAAGLTVAIPAFLAYKYVQGRVDRYAMELEDFSLQMVDLLENRSPLQPPTPEAPSPAAGTHDTAASAPGSPEAAPTPAPGAAP